jgi:hypothetical protein
MWGYRHVIELVLCWELRFTGNDFIWNYSLDATRGVSNNSFYHFLLGRGWAHMRDLFLWYHITISNIMVFRVLLVRVYCGNRLDNLLGAVVFRTQYITAARSHPSLDRICLFQPVIDLLIQLVKASPFIIDACIFNKVFTAQDNRLSCFF